MNLDELEQQREAATVDKADLFDFYHKNWSTLTEQIARYQKPRPTMRSAYLVVIFKEGKLVEASIWSSAPWETSQRMGKDIEVYLAYETRAPSFQEGIDYIKKMVADPLYPFHYLQPYMDKRQTMTVIVPEDVPLWLRGAWLDGYVGDADYLDRIERCKVALDRARAKGKDLSILTMQLEALEKQQEMYNRGVAARPPAKLTLGRGPVTTLKGGL